MRDLVIYGLGELGQLYGAAALRAGVRVTPITRTSEPGAVLRGMPADVPVLVAVGEADLEGVLAALPAERKSSVVLLQNELFPPLWRKHAITPTVMVPWLLKKKGQPQLVARPTPVFGRYAALMGELHAAIDLASVELGSEAQLHQALVDKYAFILTVNALGLLRDRTLGVWLQEDPLRVRALAEEAARLGAALCQRESEVAQSAIDVAQSATAVEEGMRGLWQMAARGRTAQSRVERALANASRAGVATPELGAVLADTQGEARR